MVLCNVFCMWIVVPTRPCARRRFSLPFGTTDTKVSVLVLMRSTSCCEQGKNHMTQPNQHIGRSRASHIYIYMYICIYAYMFIYVCIHQDIETSTYRYTFIYVYICKAQAQAPHLRTANHILSYAYAYAYVDRYVFCIQIFIWHLCIYVIMYTLRCGEEFDTSFQARNDLELQHCF